MPRTLLFSGNKLSGGSYNSHGRSMETICDVTVSFHGGKVPTRLFLADVVRNHPRVESDFPRISASASFAALSAF